MPKIIILRTLIFIISIGLSYLLPVIYQDIVGFLLILSIGVIHGANAVSYTHLRAHETQ